VILHKWAEESGIWAVGLHCINSIHEIADTPTSRPKCLSDPEVTKCSLVLQTSKRRMSLRRIIQDATHILLIRADVSGISIEDFSYYVYPRCTLLTPLRTSSWGALTSRLEWRKEGIIDLLSAINPQAIDTVRGDEVRDPSLKHTQHVSIFSP